MDYRQIIKVDFVKFDDVALEKSWKWLNDSEIKYLISAPEVDREMQKQWFEGLDLRTDYYIRAISLKENIIGVCGLKNISSVDAELWTYIGDKNYWGKTIGPQIVIHLKNVAESIGLESIYSVCLKTNLRAHKLALRFGAVQYEDINEKEILFRLEL